MSQQYKGNFHSLPVQGKANLQTAVEELNSTWDYNFAKPIASYFFNFKSS